MPPPPPEQSSTKETCSHSSKLYHPLEHQSFHPTDTTCMQAPSTLDDSMLASITSNTIPIEFFNYSSSKECIATSNMSLPAGWRLAGRKRSIFELDTNIHTLSELYTTLADLRSQLPDPVADQVEQTMFARKKPSLPRSHTSTEDVISCWSRSSSFAAGTATASSPASPSSMDIDEDNMESDFVRLYYTYPHFVFDMLLDVYLNCVCFTRQSPSKVIKSYEQGTMDKAYASAIFAYASLHVLLCHSDRFGVYSFMNQLSVDFYRVAFELVEFDAITPVACETLIIMHQYLMTMGREGEARNLFCLAQRQMEILMLGQHLYSQDLHRLYVWMAELDWSFALTKFSTPLIQYDQQLKTSLKSIKSTSKEDEMCIRATKFRLKGLWISVNDRSFQQLNQWRTKYLQVFMYKRHEHAISYTLEDKLALRLHAIYFAGMLELHQQHMMEGFESDQLAWESLSSEEGRADYFGPHIQQISHHQSQVEKGLYRSMNAAYGFIQVIKLLLDETDQCILPQSIDTVSVACTVLYFGNKVVVCNPDMIQKSQEALSFVVNAFLTSTTLATMECPRIANFVQKWSPLIS